MKSEDRLLSLLFPQGCDEKWKTSARFEEYVKRIGTLSTEELSKEPAKLKDERNHVQEQIQELAVSNYKIFLETARCSQSLFGQFTLVENKLQNLLEDIPEFEDQFKGFLSKTSDINNMRKLNSLTLTKSVQLLEILELPQLMESFINDNLYEKALELSFYVKKLSVKYPDIPIFKNIEKDVEKWWLIMLEKLLAQLRQDLQLPKCLEIVSYLRSMEIFSEPELRLQFLQARNTWLKNCSNSIPKNDAHHHLTKTIEVTRVNLFNIITQYKAIFNDDEHGPLASPTSQCVNQNVIFFNWIADQIKVFLTTLQEDLDRGITPLDTILGQCMYFGLSFSRIGCDFRSLMVPLFVKTIENSFRDSVTKATLNFEKNMERFTFINKIHSNVPWKRKNADVIKQDADLNLKPPESLLEFYPLAEYLNQILMVFNDLRTSMPIAIIKHVVCCLEESLLIISKSILVLYRAEHQAFSANSQEAFGRFCTCFVDDLVPYLQRCLHSIFPLNCIALYLGVTGQLLQNKYISIINKEKIIEPIKDLLPSKIEPNWDAQENKRENLRSTIVISENEQNDL